MVEMVEKIKPLQKELRNLENKLDQFKKEEQEIVVKKRTEDFSKIQEGTKISTNSYHYKQKDNITTEFEVIKMTPKFVLIKNLTTSSETKLRIEEFKKDFIRSFYELV